MLKVLFVCTGNACRSQIAEGWAKHLKRDSIEAYSAGICPIGVHPNAIKIMADVGVDISNQTSDHIEDFDNIDFDYVVTLCDNASQRCPVFSGNAKIIHKPFADPYLAAGTKEEVMLEFGKIRDEIKAFIETLPESLK